MTKHEWYLKHKATLETRRKERWIKEPWVKVHHYITSRCSSGGHYGKRGIKNYLSIESVKRLWIRDNASSMTRPSIDRIESKHYTYKNCRFVELSENNGRRKCKWGMGYDKCRNCGRTDRQHWTKGRCKNCYQNWYRNKYGRTK